MPCKLWAKPTVAGPIKKQTVGLLGMTNDSVTGASVWWCSHGGNTTFGFYAPFLGTRTLWESIPLWFFQNSHCHWNCSIKSLWDLSLFLLLPLSWNIFTVEEEHTGRRQIALQCLGSVSCYRNKEECLTAQWSPPQVTADWINSGLSRWKATDHSQGSGGNWQVLAVGKMQMYGWDDGDGHN